MNIFDTTECSEREETFQDLLSGTGGFRLERIVSTGQSSPPGFWYAQKEDEWVVLLQGEARLSWEDGTATLLRAGDTLFIAAHRKHRVEETTKEPPCVWLAVHGRLDGVDSD